MKDPTLSDSRLAANYASIEPHSLRLLFDKEQKRTKNESDMAFKNHDCDQSHRCFAIVGFKVLTNRSELPPRSYNCNK
ncbi:hypothetical protein [Yersinia intermedia]|uniref:Uncharacterized protein n=2 Tax=Yersiniaceae TaxID=1903411 RepID=A0ABX6F3R1_YERIN|nr:hypothetical protein [Yersinia intermedia]EEQ18677.1 hypothetical protein yinte0001_40960 [Yersinia intermedia ATCC 29909]MCB5300095.1 hypothetical protein [Yersinia intermedia]MDA5491854.1 hypothetical protein [Yersinia intermedia]QGR68105.1 hypothetical protein FOC38_20560 [Yersinia intermedia]QGR69108.1 hypothetical protein FOC37_01215 [Yersinia intermedia]